MVRRRVLARDAGSFGWKARLAPVLLYGALALAGQHACGQTAVDGAIRGIVRDASGAILPNAKVRVDGDASGVHLVALTQKDGEFVLLRVPAGVYAMTVEGSGLRRLVRQVNVELGGEAEVDVRLRGPGVTTVVTVSGEEESTTTALTSSVTPHEIERLPVNGRRWQTFALLSAGCEFQRDG